MLNSAQGGVLKPKYIQFTVLEEERNLKIFTFNKLDWKANLSEHLVIDLWKPTYTILNASEVILSEVEVFTTYIKTENALLDIK